MIRSNDNKNLTDLLEDVFCLSHAVIAHAPAARERLSRAAVVICRTYRRPLTRPTKSGASLLVQPLKPAGKAESLHCRGMHLFAITTSIMRYMQAHVSRSFHTEIPKWRPRAQSNAKLVRTTNKNRQFSTKMQTESDFQRKVVNHERLNKMLHETCRFGSGHQWGRYVIYKSMVN